MSDIRVFKVDKDNPHIREIIDRIEEIYEHIHDETEQSNSSIGWIRGIYPCRKTAEDSLERGDLFAMLDGDEIVAAAIINQTQVYEYKDADWKNDVADDEIMVLHTLVVEPGRKGKGYGREFVAYYEDYAARNSCTELRMDTNVINVRARKLYKMLGYDEVGFIHCDFNGIPNVELVCLEKQI